MQRFLILILTAAVAGFANAQPGETHSKSTSKREDSAFNQIADELISGYLDWRPQTGTSLGFHQYDGKVTDFSKASQEKELARLKDFDSRLAGVDMLQLSRTAAYDYRILQNAIKR